MGHPPQNGTNRVGRHQRAVLRENADRPKLAAALAEAKRRGVKLGGYRGYQPTAKDRAAGQAAIRERVQKRASDIMPTVKELQAAGFESLRAIAAGLEERGIPAARGGKWSAEQVARLLEAARSPFEACAVAAVA
jgi:Recombinase